MRAEREREKEGGAGKESERKKEGRGKRVRANSKIVVNTFTGNLRFPIVFYVLASFFFTNLSLNSRNFHVIKELSRIIVFCADLEISVANLRGAHKKESSRN